MNNSYDSERRSNVNNRYAAQASYPGNIRQPQYTSSGYDWPRQHQQNYSNGSGQRTTQYSDTWDNGRAQVASRVDRTQKGNYAMEVAAGRGGGGDGSGHNSTSSDIAGQNNSGLNSFAYASRPDGTVLQKQGHRQQHSTAASNLNQPSIGVNHVQSPGTTQSTPRYDTARSSRSGYQSELSSENQHNSSLGATVALAGNVSARLRPASAAIEGHFSVSPIMDKSASLQQSSSQRLTSPYHQSQVTQTQAQGRPSSTTPQTTYGATNSTVSANQQKSQQIANTGQHRRGPSLESQQRSSQRQGQPANSISSQVTPSVENSAQTQYSAILEPQSMPSYINPTQVFNPFHKEHERRRREAMAQAAAEARRKAEEEAVVKRKAEEVAAAAAKDRKQGTAAPVAASTMKEANKKTKQPTEAAHPSQNLTPSENEAQSNKQSDSVDSEPDMEAGIKAMMEKMQEFQNRNPALFQKLWDDMRKTSPDPSLAAPWRATSPGIRTRQSLPTTHGHPPPTTTPMPLQAPLQQQALPRQSTTIPTVMTSGGKSDALSVVPPTAKLNGYRVVVENNSEGLPDLGRFPAERRIRKPYPGKSSPMVDAAGANTANPIPAEIGASSRQRAVSSLTEQKSSTPAAPPAENASLVTQGLPQRKPTGETMWPEDKRNALAEVAVKFLQAVPENAEIKISPKDIHGMLEQNPSYVDLCLMLEEKGLKFHRGQFARQLLSDVSQLRGPSRTPLPPAPAVPPPSQAPVPAPAPEGSVAPSMPDVIRPGPFPASSSAPANAMNFSNALQAAKHPVFIAESPFAPQYPQMQRQRPARNRYQPRPEPVPGSKEAMARKRDFSEVVDLTALSDNDDYVMSKKQARIGSPSPEPTNLYQDHQTQPLTAYAPPPPVPYMGLGHPLPFRFDPNHVQHPQGYVLVPHQPYQLQPPAPLPAPAPAPQPPRLVRILAKPINKEEALRKTYYDAKTVARDILIAAGRHPTERPLNAHMAGLLGKYVEIDSDLSTFDWDAIDPGGPPVPQVPYADVPTEPPRFRLGEPGIRRPKLQVQPPPSEAGSTSALGTQKRLPGSEKRGILPPAPAPAPAAPAPAPVPATATDTVVPSRLKDKLTPQKPQSPASPRQSSTRSQVSRVPPQPQVAEAEKVQESTSKPGIPEKRKESQISSNGSPISERRRSTRSASTQVPSSIESKSMSSGAFFPSGKRRGRPPGAKNLHPTSRDVKNAAVEELPQIEVAIPSPTSPSLPVFRCRWKGCQARLHNLDTLRKHVAKVHRPTPELLLQEGGYICWWKKCKYLVDDGAGSLGPSKIFDNPTEWLAHIEKEHISEVASRIGDGPTTKIIDPQTLLRDKARFLSDEQGRITTPDVSVKSVQDDLESDTMTLLKSDCNDAEKQAQRSFMKTHRTEKSTPRAVAEETLKAMAARKTKIGPGIDRGGCILVNEARRATLIQNPGIQRVVDGDY